ncbi:MAG: murein transglycosylase [Rhodobacteraceae bacterium]|nr:murein transglycosylase [Paracoccaceae bacterium]MAY46184.1 murein transglycosylase [Paracoccaceae bacterium]
MHIVGQAGSFLLFLSTAAMAAPPELSLRPPLRPGVGSVELQRTSVAVLHSLMPEARDEEGDVIQANLPQSTGNARFDLWLSAFRERAKAQGIDDRTLDRAIASISYDDDAIRRDGNQSEFTKAIWDYLDSAASDTRIRNGKAALRDNAATLDAIERRYGVEKEVVAAVWGLESAYGTYRGSTHVISSMATLAFDGRRGAFFEQQLIAALKILQAGDTTPDNMTGSWAGAMGHTQFMPTSYLDYAVDFTGDGRRDIWSDDPSDALASTAAYLRRFGWEHGQPWGVEVRLPSGFDYRLADRGIQKTAADWARLGVTDMNGGAVGDHGKGSILLPAGGNGPAFMIFKNFSVIERYNTADAYVIGVGHLSDRLAGKPPIRSAWPRDDRTLTFSERKEMQQRLTNAGYSTEGVDGRIGPNTINAVRAYQQAMGLVPDGYPSMHLLTRLR